MAEGEGSIYATSNDIAEKVTADARRLMRGSPDMPPEMEDIVSGRAAERVNVLWENSRIKTYIPLFALRDLREDPDLQPFFESSHGRDVYLGEAPPSQSSGETDPGDP